MNQDDEKIDWIKEYEYIAKNPIPWLHTTQDLISAANKVLIKEIEGPLKGLYQNPGVTGVYMMLISFAIENIIKCIIIQKDPTVVSNGKLDTSISGKSGHDLRNLFQIATINCTKPEIDLLNRLSHFAIMGRYPILKKSSHGYETSKGIFLSDDLNNIINIINKLQKELNDLGIDYDIFDTSYFHTKDGKTTFVKKRINPHKFP